jgi:hypothetical protein
MQDVMKEITERDERGLTPHKFTPVPGVHKRFNLTARMPAVLVGDIGARQVGRNVPGDSTAIRRHRV